MALRKASHEKHLSEFSIDWEPNKLAGGSDMWDKKKTRQHVTN